MRIRLVLIPFFALFPIFFANSTSPKLGKNSINEVVRSMTLDEKINLVIGSGIMGKDNGVNEFKYSLEQQPKERVAGAAGNTYAIPRLGIPSVVLADGPAGLRIDATRENSKRTYYCTAFPIATALASTWNTNLIKSVGETIGSETLEYGCDVLLAPAMNIQRNPLCGRNYEYYSEDPFVSGKIAAAMVNGIQSKGVGTSIKHFAVNNQETNRTQVNAIVSQRTLREIYLKGFEIAITESKPWSLMSSYNKINGVYASQSPDFLTKILRNDFHFNGFVVSDWYAGDDATKQMIAGNDLLMPGIQAQKENLRQSIINHTLDEKVLDINVANILNIILKTPTFKNYKYKEQPDLIRHAEIARQTATEAMVLLKNEKQALPIKVDLKNIAAFGVTSYDFISGGSGSGAVNSKYTISLAEGLQNSGFNLDKELEQVYKNYISKEKAKLPVRHNNVEPMVLIPEMNLDDELYLKKAKESDVAIITLGRVSGEFMDRIAAPEFRDFELSATEQTMVRKVSLAFHALGKKVIVILNIGGVIETDTWKNYPDAILLAWQTGQESGNAVADILMGNSSPSGKLTVTFPKLYADVPSAITFPNFQIPSDVAKYDEGIFVGYRYYDTFKVNPSYEFGYGLSYTTFTYTNAKVYSDRGKIIAYVSVKNTGNAISKEIVQAYVEAPSNDIDKPLQELKAFGKTRCLRPGETERIKLTIDYKTLASFYEDKSTWIVSSGKYKIKIGASSRDIRCEKEMLIDKSLEEKVSKL